MGNSSSNTKSRTLLQKLFPKIKYRIGIVGLHGAGKTSILYKLKTGKSVDPFPSVGLNVEEFEFANVIMVAFDMCGGEEKR